MKKIYILLCITFLFYEYKAQHTLTAASNPAIGDIDSRIGLDSTGLFLGNSGTSQIWNYTGILTGTNAPFSYTYVPMSSVTNNSLYPTGTIAARVGIGGYDIIYGNTASKIEYLGFAQPTASNCQVYFDPAIFYPLPFTYGTSSSDTYSYTSWSGSYTGTVTTTGDATGTLLLPSGSFSNILRLTIIFNQLGSFTTVQTNYYSSLSKFPLLTISSTTTGTTIDISGTINTSFALGISSVSEINAPNFFPNPVTNGELFLTDPDNSIRSLLLTNILGQNVRLVNFDNNSSLKKKVDVSELGKGVYILKVNSANGVLSKKIIIE